MSYPQSAEPEPATVDYDTLRKAFMVLTRTIGRDVDLLARRLVESDARTLQPWIVTAQPFIAAAEREP